MRKDLLESYFIGLMLLLLLPFFSGLTVLDWGWILEWSNFVLFLQFYVLFSTGIFFTKVFTQKAKKDEKA